MLCSHLFSYVQTDGTCALIRKSIWHNIWNKRLISDAGQITTKEATVCIPLNLASIMNGRHCNIISHLYIFIVVHIYSTLEQHCPIACSVQYSSSNSVHITVNHHLPLNGINLIHSEWAGPRSQDKHVLSNCIHVCALHNTSVVLSSRQTSNQRNCIDPGRKESLVQFISRVKHLMMNKLIDFFFLPFSYTIFQIFRTWRPS